MWILANGPDSAIVVDDGKDQGGSWRKQEARSTGTTCGRGSVPGLGYLA